MKTRLGGMVIAFAMIAFLIWLYLPFYFMFISAFKDAGEIQSYPPTLIFQPSISAFLAAFTPNGPGHLGLNWPLFFKNSFLLATGGTALALLLGVPVAFALAHLELRNKYQIAFSFLTLRMLPPIVSILPVYIILTTVHLIDTYPGIILEYVLLGLPWVVWLNWSFAEAIPRAYIDSARTDGASDRVILWRIVLPLIRPGLIVSAVFAFLQMYNDSIISGIIGGGLTETVPLGLSSEISNYIQNLNVVFAVGVLNLIPAVILAMLVRKYWARGLSFGMVK